MGWSLEQYGQGKYNNLFYSQKPNQILKIGGKQNNVTPNITTTKLRFFLYKSSFFKIFCQIRRGYDTFAPRRFTIFLMLNRPSNAQFMRRCFDLARLGAGRVSPNPMVGAVVVKDTKIIGEGYHQQYGQAHAEVNALNSVQASHLKQLHKSKIFVSLEPCNFHGNTPACTQLLLYSGISNILIAAIDHTPAVNGAGMQVLKSNGCKVSRLLQEQGERLCAIRNTFVSLQRPYIVLKFAQSANGFIGQPDRPVPISNSFSQRLVHKWRSQLDAILIGTNTAAIDNAQLNTRFGWGASPLRLVIDRHLRLPKSLYIFDDRQATRIITHQSPPKSSYKHTEYWQFEQGSELLDQLMHRLYKKNISSLLVEGGTSLLQSFIDKGLWDEARVFTSQKLLPAGLPAPKLRKAREAGKFKILDDLLKVYYRQED